MKHLSLLTSPIIRMLDKVVSRRQGHPHEHPTRMRKRLGAAHQGGEVVVHQIRTRMVMEEPPRGMPLPERQIHLVVTVARLPLGMPRRARRTRTRMVAKHQLGPPPHGRLIRIKMEGKPLCGVPRHRLPTDLRTMILQAGVTMGAERLVRAEDGVILRITTHGATHHLHGQLMQVTPHG